MIQSLVPQPGSDIVGNLSDFLPSWRRHLRAENKAPRTIQSYLEGVQKFGAFLTANELPQSAHLITRRHIEAFEESLLDRFTPATAANRHRSLQQFFRWLVEDGELNENPMARLSTPIVPEIPVPLVSDDSLRQLLASCDRRSFVGQRDEAIIRTFIDTGLRLAEVAGLTTTDTLNTIDVDAAEARVIGKGRRPRIVPLSSRTIRALDRYLRARKRHPYEAEPAFWLGLRGRLTESGISQMIATRSERANVDHIHPHMFRHTFAHHWKAQGGSEEDLMRLAGWRSRDMLLRYGASSANERASASHRLMRPGDRI